MRDRVVPLKQFLNEFFTLLFSKVNDYYDSVFNMKEHFRISLNIQTK